MIREGPPSDKGVPLAYRTHWITQVLQKYIDKLDELGALNYGKDFPWLDIVNFIGSFEEDDFKEEGQMLNEELHGFGSETLSNGAVCYSKTWIDGLKNGIVVCKWLTY